MNYLIPMFDCYLLDNNECKLNTGVKYVCDFTKSGMLRIVRNGFTQSICMVEDDDNFLKVKFKSDSYFFFLPHYNNDIFFTEWSYKNQKICLSLGRKLFLTVDGNLLLEEMVNNLKYSHHKIEKGCCLIYFTGKRNYVICLKQDEVVFSTYYDECNFNDDETYFMCRLNDSLNHGRVYHIKAEDVNSYLVYLDDDELKLKQDFVAIIFLDCLKAGNLKYCNELLDVKIRFDNEKDIKEFFCDFDYIHQINKNEIILIKKNTLAGIYSFEIENNLITNINQLV